METTNENSLYCVIAQHTIGDFLRYPESKEFLIMSDHPVKTFDLMDAVKKYMAVKNEIHPNFISIYDITDISKTEDKEKWYKTVEKRQWCFKYYNGKIFQTFL